MKSPIELALNYADLQTQPNYSAIARKFGCDRSALSKRHRGKTTSKSVMISEVRRSLTDCQEEVLITQINKLTDRGIPPTSQMVHNLAEEIIAGHIGKNWVGRFVQRHKDRLTSVYLRNIDNVRKKAEYEPVFQVFYDLVK